MVVSLRLATVMIRSLASVTGPATSDTRCHTPTAVRGGGEWPRSRHLLRPATTYHQINDLLSEGIENRQVGQQPVQHIRLHNNLKQFSKVGFEEAKAWMEWRLAAMKNRVPKADTAELAQDWLASLEHNKVSDLDPVIA